MKKFARILISATTVVSMVVSPIAVHAQDASPIVIDDTLPTTGATTPAPATPDTGIAPPSNKLVQNGAVFVGGGLLGTLLGLGVINYRKSKLQK